MEHNKMTVEIGDYKGNAVLTIKDGDYNLITFGARKASAILANIEAVKSFVAQSAELEAKKNATRDAEKTARLVAKLTPAQRNLLLAKLK